jgi:hypothetical protein
VEQDGDFYRAALGFEGTGAGGADAAQGARGLHPTAPALQGGSGHGAGAVVSTRGRWQGERERRADRRVPVGRETRGGSWYAGEPAGCVGLKGQAGCGLGGPEE